MCEAVPHTPLASERQEAPDRGGKRWSTLAMSTVGLETPGHRDRRLVTSRPVSSTREAPGPCPAATRSHPISRQQGQKCPVVKANAPAILDVT